MLTNPKLVISETDIEVALTHLDGLPFGSRLAHPWYRKQLLDAISLAAGNRPKAGQCLHIAPGVYGVVTYYGFDMKHDAAHAAKDDATRLQVVLAVRSAVTDPARMTVLT